MNRSQQRKLTRQEPNPNPNARLINTARTSSLLAYRAIWARLRERGIGETVTTCRLAEYLLIHIDIRGASGCLSFPQSWRHWARFLRRHKPQKLQPTERMSLRSSWSWVRLRGLWQAPEVVAVGSVSNGSNPLERFRVRVGTGTEPLRRFLPHENPDHCNWAGFTTKNPAFQPHDFGSN